MFKEQQECCKNNILPSTGHRLPPKDKWISSPSRLNFFSFSPFNCCLSVVLLLDKRNYPPQNSQVVFCPNKYLFFCFLFVFVLKVLYVWISIIWLPDQGIDLCDPFRKQAVAVRVGVVQGRDLYLRQLSYREHGTSRFAVPAVHMHS